MSPPESEDKPAKLLRSRERPPFPCKTDLRVIARGFVDRLRSAGLLCDQRGSRLEAFHVRRQGSCSSGADPRGVAGGGVVVTGTSGYSNGADGGRTRVRS